MVFKGHDKSDDSSGMMSKTQASKFLAKARSGNSQYTSTNSSFGLECSKMTEQDVQEEFLRLYTQLELLKEKNMRVGNRHLASKINAMQKAASRHDQEQGGEEVARDNCKLNNMLCAVTDRLGVSSDPAEEAPPKTKRQSVSFAQTPTTAADGAPEAEKEACATVQEASEAEASSKTDEAIVEVSSSDERGDSPSSSRNGRVLKSGHARTHAIVINLDDKSRFTEEVTV